MAKKKRVVIVFDGEEWFVRRLASSVNVCGDRDEMVYTCDAPLGPACSSPEMAVSLAKAFLKGPKWNASLWATVQKWLRAAQRRRPKPPEPTHD